jgi:hypothetical protein
VFIKALWFKLHEQSSTARVPLLCCVIAAAERIGRSSRDPWNWQSKFLTEINRGFVEGLPGRRSPQIKLVSRRAAFETTIRVFAEIRRE